MYRHMPCNSQADKKNHPLVGKNISVRKVKNDDFQFKSSLLKNVSI